jgi:predicted dehydrogenase
MVNPDLAGGALLDLGVYSLNWVFQTLYHTKSDEEKETPNVVSAINKYDTGADEMTSIIVQFPKSKSMGIATTALRVATDLDGQYTGGPAIRIQGSGGEIQVTGPAFRPTEYKVIKKDGNGHIETVQVPIPQDPKRGNWGHGMFWEADECARCLRDGKKQSDSMPWSESLLIMETMDSVLQQGGVKYPDLITSDVYEANGTLNTGRK